MFTTPRRATLPIFTNYDSKPDTGTTLAIFATLTQFQHAITQFAAHYSELAAGAVAQPRPGVQPPPRNTPAISKMSSQNIPLKRSHGFSGILTCKVEPKIAGKTKWLRKGAVLFARKSLRRLSHAKKRDGK